ncbi:MAG TPA: 50S ribosomal protein L24 [Candidatus Omnitrophota bacterium]|nr:50S ribosomal protein L24 [Candidatus Omnitrophota bacterium]
MYRIRKDDLVYVVVGKDKGKTGKVLHVYPKLQRALVESINVVKKAMRRTQDNQKGGFVEIEMPIHISNLMLADKKTNKPVRLGAKFDKSGSKERISRKSGEVI